MVTKQPSEFGQPCIKSGQRFKTCSKRQLTKNFTLRDISKEMNVPFEYLREISKASLPLTVEAEAQIDKLRLLRAAGLVAAMLPHPLSGINYARVLAITPQGRDVLATEREPLRP